MPCNDLHAAETMTVQLRGCRLVRNIYLLVSEEFANGNPAPADCEYIIADSMFSSATMRAIAMRADADYALLLLKDTPLTFGMYAVERMMRIGIQT